MKLTINALLLAGVLASTTHAVAADATLSPFQGVSEDNTSEDADSDDPCVTVMCLYGKVTGNSQDECDPAIKKFQSIKATKKHGVFDPTKTLKKRTQFVNSCPSADSAIRKMVLSAYGKLKKI